MDISDTLAPKSDQLDAIDLAASGPRTFTIAGVKRGNVEQPVQVELAEFPRVWRPSKGMRRVLAAVWGPDAATWTGNRVRLFCDESVMFGKERVMGIRIEAMSGITKPREVPLLVSRGKSAIYIVKPLVEDAPAVRRPQGAAQPPSEAQTARDDLLAFLHRAGIQPSQALDRWANTHDGEDLRDAVDAESIRAMQGAWEKELGL